MILKIIKNLFIYLFATLSIGNAVAATGPVLVLLPVYASYSSITANITSKLTAAGYSVTTHTGVPAGSLSSYKQIWDVRDPVGTTVRISSTDRDAFLTYLQGGGSLFIMGENPGCCATRTTDIAAMVSLAGGGTLGSFSTASSAQTVRSPFNSKPNALTTVTFGGGGSLAANGMGSGLPITSNDSGAATAIYWGPGSLSSATAGTLITVLDIDFLNTGSHSLFPLVENLIAYMADPVASTPTYTVGGNVTGLATGQSVVLLNNNGNSTTVNSNSSFTFSTAINSGSAYAVTVGTQPTGQTCTVTDGTGTVSGNVTGVSVSCAANTVNGSCGTAAGTAASILPSSNLCTAGTAGQVSSSQGQYSWTCSGTSGGTNASCAAPWATNAGSGSGSLSASGNGWAVSSASFTATPAATPPAGVTFPNGLLDLRLSTGTAGTDATVVVQYTTAVPAGAVYMKYGQTKANPTDHWYQLDASRAVFSQDRMSVTLTLTDGGAGDNDLLPNGTIVDPGGPALVAAPAPIPTLSEWAMILMASLMGLFAFTRIRRQS